MRKKQLLLWFLMYSVYLGSLIYFDMGKFQLLFPRICFLWSENIHTIWNASYIFWEVFYFYFFHIKHPFLLKWLYKFAHKAGKQGVKCYKCSLLFLMPSKENIKQVTHAGHCWTSTGFISLILVDILIFFTPDLQYLSGMLFLGPPIGMYHFALNIVGSLNSKFWL